jgi:hypothetical protein
MPGKRGIYHADFHYRGKHRRKSFRTTNVKMARRKALKLAIEIQEGTLDAPQDERLGRTATDNADTFKRTSLIQARTKYVEFKKAAGNQKKSWGKDDGTLKGFVAFAATKKVTRVDQVTLSLVDDYSKFRSEQKVRGKKIGPTQKWHDNSLLKRFLQWCAGSGHDARESFRQSAACPAQGPSSPELHANTGSGEPNDAGPS